MGKKAINLAIILGLMSAYVPLSLTAPVAQAAEVEKSVKVPNGTPVIVKLTDEVNSKTALAGTNVDFTVVGDVKVDNAVVIRNGALGHAQVASAEKSGFIGDEGSVVISDFYVQAVDGGRIPLAATLSQRGKDRQVMSIALGIIVCLPFLLIKGNNAVIPAGTQKTVFTATDVTVKVTP